MDRAHEDDLKSLGFVGIYRESFRAIFGWKKIFTLITFTLILPLCAISVSHSKVSELFFGKLLKNRDLGAYDMNDNDGNGELTVTDAKYGWIALWLSKIVFFVLYFAFSLLPTSVIVDAIFSIYTNRNDVTFLKAITMVPKVFKKVGVTFLWSLGFYSIFNLTFLGMLILWTKFIRTTTTLPTEAIVLIIIIVALYIGTFPYLLMIWQLANVASVLEDVSGRQALWKGWVLMKGKKGPYISSSVLLLVLLTGVHIVFLLFAGTISSIFDSGGRFMLGFGCILVLMMLELLRLVSHTVVYFVCKSYHHESIDGSSHRAPWKGQRCPL